MHAPFPSLGLNNSHLQGPQDAMKVSTKASSTSSLALRLITLCKAIYKKYPMGFLLPIVQGAPLSVELPPDVSLHLDLIASKYLTKTTDSSHQPYRVEGHRMLLQCRVPRFNTRRLGQISHLQAHHYTSYRAHHPIWDQNPHTLHRSSSTERKAREPTYK